MSCAAFSFVWEGFKGGSPGELWWLADSNGEDLSSTTSGDLGGGAVKRELLQSETKASPHVLDETCVLF
jgi:hypothetical protein